MSKTIGTAVLTILVLFGASAGSAFAEESAVPSPDADSGGFVFCLGATFSKLAYDSESQKFLDESGIEAKRRPGLLAGLGYEISLGNRLSVMPAIYYSSLGDRLVAETGEGDQVLAGIIVPIELKLKFNGPFLAAGPYLGFLTSAKLVLDDGTAQEIADINKFHYGISLGAGYELRMGGLALLVKAGCQIGLSNFAKTESEEDTSRARHAGFAVLLGLKI